MNNLLIVVVIQEKVLKLLRRKNKPWRNKKNLNRFDIIKKNIARAGLKKVNEDISMTGMSFDRRTQRNSPDSITNLNQRLDKDKWKLRKDQVDKANKWAKFKMDRIMIVDRYVAARKT